MFHGILITKAGIYKLEFPKFSFKGGSFALLLILDCINLSGGGPNIVFFLGSWWGISRY